MLELSIEKRPYKEMGVFHSLLAVAIWDVTSDVWVNSQFILLQINCVYLKVTVSVATMDRWPPLLLTILLISLMETVWQCAEFTAGNSPIVSHSALNVKRNRLHVRSLIPPNIATWNVNVSMRALGFLTIVLRVINDFRSISVTKSAELFKSVTI